jgi:alkylhydroperoxidase/carboxymuconolactone decarboxylase family protein YurZ
MKEKLEGTKISSRKARKATLGGDYVENNLAAADFFTRPFQEAMTAWCWGFGWGDPALDPKTRSMMNLAMIAALGKMHEWELHCHGALNNGVTVEEIRAIIYMWWVSIAAFLRRSNASERQDRCWKNVGSFESAVSLNLRTLRCPKLTALTWPSPGIVDGVLHQLKPVSEAFCLNCLKIAEPLSSNWSYAGEH